MKLPHLGNAVVTQDKVEGYLLSLTHPVGRFKARFFARFGFSAGFWEALADALLRHAEANEVVESDDTELGTRYTVEGPLEAPDGRRPMVRVVWCVERDETAPRLVTAYPR